MQFSFNTPGAMFGPSSPAPGPKNYNLSNSCFSYGGTEYKMGEMGTAAFWTDAPPYFNFVITPPNEWPLSGTDNIDCGLYQLMGSSVTLWYEHGKKATIDALIAGAGGVCDAYSEGLLVPTGGVFAYSGDPGGWDIVSGYTDPPTLVAA